jgi:hypothetical protein
MTIKKLQQASNNIYEATVKISRASSILNLPQKFPLDLMA